MSQMKTVRTSELIGPALDYAVAMAELRDAQIPASDVVWDRYFGATYSPSINWTQVGPLIEKYNIQTSYNGNGFPRSPTGKYWCAHVCKPHGPEERPSGGGPTPLIAACRAIVAVNLGDEVQIPVGLLP